MVDCGKKTRRYIEISAGFIVKVIMHYSMGSDEPSIPQTDPDRPRRCFEKVTGRFIVVIGRADHRLVIKLCEQGSSHSKFKEEKQ